MTEACPLILRFHQMVKVITTRQDVSFSNWVHTGAINAMNSPGCTLPLLTTDHILNTYDDLRIKCVDLRNRWAEVFYYIPWHKEKCEYFIQRYTYIWRKLVVETKSITMTEKMNFVFLLLVFMSYRCGSEKRYDYRPHIGFRDEKSICSRLINNNWILNLPTTSSQLDEQDFMNPIWTSQINRITRTQWSVMLSQLMRVLKDGKDIMVYRDAAHFQSPGYTISVQRTGKWISGFEMDPDVDLLLMKYTQRSRRRLSKILANEKGWRSWTATPHHAGEIESFISDDTGTRGLMNSAQRGAGIYLNMERDQELEIWRINWTANESCNILGLGVTKNNFTGGPFSTDQAKYQLLPSGSGFFRHCLWPLVNLENVVGETFPDGRIKNIVPERKLIPFVPSGEIIIVMDRRASTSGFVLGGRYIEASKLFNSSTDLPFISFTGKSFDIKIEKHDLTTVDEKWYEDNLDFQARLHARYNDPSYTKTISIHENQSGELRYKSEPSHVVPFCQKTTDEGRKKLATLFKLEGITPHRLDKLMPIKPIQACRTKEYVDRKNLSYLFQFLRWCAVHDGHRVTDFHNYAKGFETQRPDFKVRHIVTALSMPITLADQTANSLIKTVKECEKFAELVTTLLEVVLAETCFLYGCSGGDLCKKHRRTTAIRLLYHAMVLWCGGSALWCSDQPQCVMSELQRYMSTKEVVRSKLSVWEFTTGTELPSVDPRDEDVSSFYRHANALPDLCMMNIRELIVVPLPWKRAVCGDVLIELHHPSEFVGIFPTDKYVKKRILQDRQNVPSNVHRALSEVSRDNWRNTYGKGFSHEVFSQLEYLDGYTFGEKLDVNSDGPYTYLKLDFDTDETWAIWHIDVSDSCGFAKSRGFGKTRIHELGWTMTANNENGEPFRINRFPASFGDFGLTVKQSFIYKEEHFSRDKTYIPTSKDLIPLGSVDEIYFVADRTRWRLGVIFDGRYMEPTGAEMSRTDAMAPMIVLAHASFCLKMKKISSKLTPLSTSPLNLSQISAKTSYLAIIKALKSKFSWDNRTQALKARERLSSPAEVIYDPSQLFQHHGNLFKKIIQTLEFPMTESAMREICTMGYLL